jgi:hypothetical protein
VSGGNQGDEQDERAPHMLGGLGLSRPPGPCPSDLGHHLPFASASYRPAGNFTTSRNRPASSTGSQGGHYEQRPGGRREGWHSHWHLPAITPAILGNHCYIPSPRGRLPPLIERLTKRVCVITLIAASQGPGRAKAVEVDGCWWCLG